MKVCKNCHDKDNIIINCKVKPSTHLQFQGSVVDNCEICGKKTHLMRCFAYDVEIFRGFERI